MFGFDDILGLVAGALITSGVSSYFSEKSAKKERERRREQYNKELNYESNLKKQDVKHTIGDIKEKIRSRTLGGGIREGTYESALSKVSTAATQRIDTNLQSSLQKKPKESFWDWLF